MSNLSQEEIDALLNGGASSSATVEAAAPTGEMDISSYLKEASQSAEGESGYSASVGDMGTRGMFSFAELEERLVRLDKSGEYLTAAEKDILGEAGNICMGASATTMYTLLGRRVTITTPQVHVYTSEEVLSVYESPFVLVTVEYNKGITGKNILILREYDSLLMTDLLMGGEGNVNRDDIELDEIHLSAMSEIMNQMIGSSATSLSNMLGRAIDITPPQAVRVQKNTDVNRLLDGTELVVKVSFDMEIEGVLKSKLVQLMSIESSKALVQAMMGTDGQKESAGKASVPSKEPAREVKPAASPERGRQIQEPVIEPPRTVNVKPIQYQDFEEEKTAPAAQASGRSIDLISDIPLQVAVELGKTQKNIHDILNMGIGSVIVLDKMAGELVEVVVNGKYIARGEVVVIDENYGVRITDIIMNHEGSYIA